MIIGLGIAFIIITGCSIEDTSSEQDGKTKDIPKVEKPYPPEKAIENGNVVNLHGKYSNLDIWRNFVEKFENKQASKVRITKYTIEGDPIFYELIYNGKEIEYTYDNSMDAYGGDRVGNTICEGLQKKFVESISDEVYILNGCASEDIGNTFHFRGQLLQQQNVIGEYEQEIEELREEIDSTLEVGTGSKETITRKIEGMEQEIEVINYRIDPYNIHYQLDESFGVPEVNQNKITYSSQNNMSIVSFEVMENSSFEQVVSNLQKRFEKDGYEDKGELGSTLIEENGLRGKMQFFVHPVKGFYAYEIGKNVLAITYQYSAESGDGMFPLLESLRKSINASIDVNSCETAPKTLNWNNKEYILITENTSQEPVMKYGFLKCSNGKFIGADEEDNNSYTVRGDGNPTSNKNLIIIGKWGRALYSPVKILDTIEEEQQFDELKDEKYGILNPTRTKEELRKLIDSIAVNQKYHVEILAELNNITSTRKIEYDGKTINYYFQGKQELTCKTITKKTYVKSTIFHLDGCDNGRVTPN